MCLNSNLLILKTIQDINVNSESIYRKSQWQIVLISLNYAYFINVILFPNRTLKPFVGMMTQAKVRQCDYFAFFSLVGFVY